MNPHEIQIIIEAQNRAKKIFDEVRSLARSTARAVEQEWNIAHRSIGHGLNRLERGFIKLGEKVVKYQSLIIGAAGAMAVQFTRASVNAAIELERLTNGLTALTGSSAKAQQAIRDLREIAQLPGVTFNQAIEARLLLESVQVEGRQANAIITEFGNALALAGDPNNLRGVVIQLQQMLSAGKVLTADLRPIITQVPVFAQAMRVAFGTVRAEDIEALGVSAEEFVRRITGALGDLPRATGGAANAVVNLNAAFTEFQASVGGIILPAWTQAALDMTVALQGLSAIAAQIPALPSGTGRSLLRGAARATPGVEPFIAAFNISRAFGGFPTGAAGGGGLIGGPQLDLQFGQAFLDSPRLNRRFGGAFLGEQPAGFSTIAERNRRLSAFQFRNALFQQRQAQLARLSAFQRPEGGRAQNFAAIGNFAQGLPQTFPQINPFFGAGIAGPSPQFSPIPTQFPQINPFFGAGIAGPSPQFSPLSRPLSAAEQQARRGVGAANALPQPPESFGLGANAFQNQFIGTAEAAKRASEEQQRIADLGRQRVVSSFATMFDQIAASTDNGAFRIISIFANLAEQISSVVTNKAAFSGFGGIGLPIALAGVGALAGVFGGGGSTRRSQNEQLEDQLRNQKSRTHAVR